MKKTESGSSTPSSEGDIKHAVSHDGRLTAGGLCSGIEEEPPQNPLRSSRRQFWAEYLDDDRGGPNIIGGR